MAAATPAPPSPSDSISAKGGSAPTIRHPLWMGGSGCGCPLSSSKSYVVNHSSVAPSLSTLSRAERAQASERYYCPAKAGRGREKILWSLVRRIICPCPTHPCAGRRAAWWRLSVSLGLILYGIPDYFKKLSLHLNCTFIFNDSCHYWRNHLVDNETLWNDDRISHKFCIRR